MLPATELFKKQISHAGLSPTVVEATICVLMRAWGITTAEEFEHMIAIKAEHMKTLDDILRESSSEIQNMLRLAASSGLLK